MAVWESSSAYWRPVIIDNLATKKSGIAFAPLFDDVVIAIPAALVEDKYAIIPRCWALLRTDDSDEFHLFGKSKIVTPPKFLTVESNAGEPGTVAPRKLTVFGQLKGTWASAFDVVSKRDNLGMDCGELLAECFEPIDGNSRDS
jgi:hypothetical protein